MTPITPPLSPRPQAFTSLMLLGPSAKVNSATLILHMGTCVILYAGGAPIAVHEGSVLYFPDIILTRAESRFLNKYQPDLPRVRTQPASYDFILGSALTKAGLALTTLLSRPEGPTQ